MTTHPITIAIVGSGPVADLLAHRIGKRTDLKLGAVRTSAEAPPEDTDCVLYLPTSTELGAGTAASRISGLLRAGFDVISTVPPVALSASDLLAACRAGSATFHGTGGFQSSLITRFNRAFASITRNIRNIELIEELEFGESPPYPWLACADCGLDEHDTEKLNARTANAEHFYDAGLHTLSEAVFGNERADERITCSATHTQQNDPPQRRRPAAQQGTAQVLVQRELGSHVAYDSVWTKRQGSSTPLRYRLNTTSTDAIGHVTITFHAGSDIHPADHLACIGMLDAIAPVHASAPGVLRQDLEINHVKLNDCLAR